jgi:hypothetical protein
VLVLEIAAQGVKGVSPAGGSARLRPGYNVLGVDGTALHQLLLALFFPRPRDVDALRAPGAASAPMRAGLTIAGSDGLTYRLLRDFAATSQLLKFDSQRRAFATVSEDPQEIARLLQAEVGIHGDPISGLLTLSSADLPSRRCAILAALPSGLEATRQAMSPADAERRLAELRDELDRSHRVEKLQYQLDGLQARLFKAEEAMKEGARLREAVQEAGGALAALAPAAAAAERLGDVEARLAAHEKSEARREEAMKRTAEEQSAIQDAESQGVPAPFWVRPKFWAAVGGGAAALAAAVALGGSGGLRYVGLLDIPSFGWAAWIALSWVSELERSGRLERRRLFVEEHERKVGEAFERETADVREAMQAVGVRTLPELREALQRLEDARAAAASARERLEVFEARPEAAAERQERESAARELREVEAVLAAETGGFVRDPRSVEAEIQRLERELATSELASAGAPDPPAEKRDPFDEFLERAAALHPSGNPATAILALQAKASQALQALSGGRLGGVSTDDKATLLANVGGRVEPMARLAPADQDLAYLALRLAMMERVMATSKAMGLVEGGFSAMPEGVRRMMARILKQAARLGQIAHATSEPCFREAAEHVV